MRASVLPVETALVDTAPDGAVFRTLAAAGVRLVATHRLHIHVDIVTDLLVLAGWSLLLALLQLKHMKYLIHESEMKL